MVEDKKGYVINDIFQGGYSSLKPGEGPYINPGSFGLTTNPQTANQLQEVNRILSTGAKQIEIEALSPEIFDAIPKPHLKEINRLTKLTGIDVSLHGPVINTSGLGRGGYSETEREAAEKTVTETLIRSHELNPEGNITVNFHSAEGLPGSQMLPPKKRKEKETYKRMIAVNKDTGSQMIPVESETLYFPGGENIEKGEYRTPDQRIDTINKTQWDNQISQMIFNKERMDEILERNKPLLQHIVPEIMQGKIDPRYLEGHQKDAWRKFQDAHSYLQDLNLQANTIFSKAWEFGDEHQKELLQKVSDEYKKQLEESQKNLDPFAEAKAMHDLLLNLKSPQVAPKVFVPIEEFALDKSSQTYGNAAFESYKKHKDKAPILVIENPPAGFALSTGKDIKEIVEKSREQFVKKAVEDGLAESYAKKQAEKLIGATWDISHINMLRKFGYEEEDIIKETEEVAPYVKHVHLADNFGMEHTELPLGMGNVPFKEIMEKLGQKGYDAKKIIEAGHWFRHFGNVSPFQETLEATKSPVYGMKMAPYWAQATGLYQGYMGGLEGSWMPQIHYETFGTSWARLPTELGGQQPGAQGGRMSGRPMQ